MSRLAGRVAVVTGAGRGIGRAIASRLAAEGAAVVANDLDEDPAAETAAALQGAGGRALAVAGDVAAPGLGERLVEAALDGFGGLHIVVNNAGYIWNSALLNHTDEQWQAMMEVHATGPFRVLRAAGRHFREAARAEAEAGTPVCRKVVNISSVSGLHGAATQASYAAAKMAVVGLTKSLAREWGRYNVTVNCVAFGAIDTRLIQPFAADGPKTIEVHGRRHKVGFDDAAREAIRSQVPLGRIGTPEDAAGAVLLLCLPESDYVTGEVLTCSGGLAL